MRSAEVGSSSIIETIRRIAESEVRKMHIAELAIVTSVFPHSEDGDKDNYECNIKLKDKEVELRKVPVATQHIGLANIPHVGDLVLVSFVNGSINSPIIIGRLYNDEDRPPLNNEEEMIYRPPYSKDTQLRRLNIVLPESTVTINIYDDRLSVIAGKSTISANSSGQIVVSSGTNSDGGGGSSITLDDTGVLIDSDSDIHIRSKGNTTIECDGDLSINGQAMLSIKSGSNLNIQSSDLMAIKSDALANIESIGPMTVKGAIINLNP
jgi:phage baseplate assembly protein gpV